MMMYPQRKLPRYQIETLKGYIIPTPPLNFHLHVVEKQPYLTQKLLWNSHPLIVTLLFLCLFMMMQACMKQSSAKKKSTPNALTQGFCSPLLNCDSPPPDTPIYQDIAEVSAPKANVNGKRVSGHPPACSLEGRVIWPLLSLLCTAHAQSNTTVYLSIRSLTCTGNV